MAFLDVQADNLMDFVHNTNKRLHDLERYNMKLEKQLSFSNAKIQELVLANVRLKSQTVGDRLKICEIETNNKKIKEILSKYNNYYDSTMADNFNINEYKRKSDEIIGVKPYISKF